MDPKRVIGVLGEEIYKTDLLKRIEQLDKRFLQIQEFVDFKEFVLNDEDRKRQLAQIMKMIKQNEKRVADNEISLHDLIDQVKEI